jgi:hypothetical protein
MVDQSGWSVRNKLNEFFAKENHVRLAKNQISKARVDFGVFTPLALFAAGEQGAWFEPSPTTCFTDTARTTPASVGQAVAGMTDLSGRGNHATQDITSARPILRQAGTGEFYLEFDGIDDSMVTPSIDFTRTDEMSVFAGVRKENVAGTVSPIVLNGERGTTNGAFALYAPHNDATRQYAWSVAGGIQNFKATDEGRAAPDTTVMTLISKISSAVASKRLVPRLDGVTKTTFSVNVAGTAAANFRSDTIRIGLQAGTSNYFKGRIYSIIARGALTEADLLTNTEQYVASKTAGVTLP